MPAVFLGSFLGIMLGKLLEEYVQIIIFGITVAWSIKTTWAKARKLINEEKQAKLETNTAISDTISEASILASEVNSPELQAIRI